MDKQKIRVGGVARLRAWDRGRLEALMQAGLSFGEAQARLEPVAEKQAHNLVTTAGLELFAKLITGNTPYGLRYLALGTSTAAPAAGDTALGSESARKIYTNRTYFEETATFSVFFLASECAFHIQEGGWFGDTSASETAGSGTLFSHWLEDFDNSAGMYDLTVDYSLEILEI